MCIRDRIRALGVGSNAEIIDLFGEEPKILASFTKDTSTNYEEGLLELYKNCLLYTSRCV